MIDHFTKEQIAYNRLQLKASIYVVGRLAFQVISFRGRDESFSSSNHGNFLKTLNIVTFWNEKVVDIIEKLPKMQPTDHLRFKRKFYMFTQPK